MTVTRQQLAIWLEEAGPLGGIGERESYAIDRVSALDAATPSAAVFAATPDALTAALAGGAGLILSSVSPSAASLDEGTRVILVRDARLAFALLAAQLRSRTSAGVHPSAIIHETAKLAPDAEVGPGSVIEAGVTVGFGARIASRVVLERGITLGNRVSVQSGAVLGAYGFGYARRPGGAYLLFPQQGTLVVEDDVEIGANSTIDRGALGETRIGAGTKIDNLVHIGHNCMIGRNVILAAQTGISGSTVVQDGAILGGQVGVGEHATVGAGVILGGGAGVLSGKKLFGAGQVFWGSPAQPLKRYLRDLARLRRGV